MEHCWNREQEAVIGCSMGQCCSIHEFDFLRLGSCFRFRREWTNEWSARWSGLVPSRNVELAYGTWGKKSHTCVKKGLRRVKRQFSTLVPKTMTRPFFRMGRSSCRVSKGDFMELFWEKWDDLSFVFPRQSSVYHSVLVIWEFTALIVEGFVINWTPEHPKIYLGNDSSMGGV